MTNYEKLKLMNIEEMSEWLDQYGQFDGSLWMNWFDEQYCKNCDSVMCHYENSNHEFHCAWCELHDKCKFFQELDDVPDNKEIIKMWLENGE